MKKHLQMGLLAGALVLGGVSFVAQTVRADDAFCHNGTCDDAFQWCMSWDACNTWNACLQYCS